MKNIKNRVAKFMMMIGLASLGAGAAQAQTTSWTYTALGDSVATGAFAMKGYVPRYRDFVAADNNVSVTLYNQARNSDTSIGLLTVLSQFSDISARVGSSQVITFNIGGNDLRNGRDSYRAGTCGGVDNQDCLRTNNAKFKTNFEASIKKILTLRGLPLNGTPNTSTIIRTMDIYNPYVNTDKASDTWKGDDDLTRDGVQSLNNFQVFKPYVDDMNTFIQTISAQYNIPCARVYAAFNGPNGDVDPSTYGYIQWDGLHPNDKGHGVIATLLRNLGYAPLR